MLVLGALGLSESHGAELVANSLIEHDGSMKPSGVIALDMSTLRFFREFAIVLVLLFLSLGALLLHESIVSLGIRQPWGLLTGALLCSLGLFVVYFLCKPSEK
jgi:hypothetical protein